jgi:hypothetical protein
MGLVDTEIKICIDEQCEVLDQHAFPVVRSRMLSAASSEEEQEGPNTRPDPSVTAKPVVPPKTSREAGGVAIEMIMNKLGSMTAIEGGVEVEYHHKDPKTGEETDLKVKVNGTFGKGGK